MLPRFLCQTQGAKENEVTMAVLLSSPLPHHGALGTAWNL